ncbi:MAG: metal-dependent hydrolase, partial [Dokdonia donghaensis]|nr:metal-dependent hydrolase [Dokdonia donghaensis]
SFFDSQPIVYKTFPKKRAQAQKWIETDEVQRLITISEGWYILEKEEESWGYNDLRFGLITNDDNDSQFVFRYLLTENDGTITATEDRPKPENGKKLLIDLWQRIKGN